MLTAQRSIKKGDRLAIAWNTTTFVMGGGKLNDTTESCEHLPSGRPAVAEFEVVALLQGDPQPAGAGCGRTRD
jgi:hypothetical protein